MRLQRLTAQISSFFALFLLCSFSFAEEVKPTVIALFGDSISVGENISSYLSECPQAGGARPGSGLGRTDFCTPDKDLQAILVESKRPSIVVNHGVGGSTTGPQGFNDTGNGLQRMASALASTRSTHDGSAYFVLILYGTNDPGSGLPVDATRQNIQQMVSIARQQGFTPIVSNLLPRSDRNVSFENSKILEAANNTAADFVNQFSNFIAESGDGTGFSLLDAETSQRTGGIIRLHPTGAGYQVVAQQWFDSSLSTLIQQLEDELPPALPFLFLLLDDEPSLIPPVVP